MATAAVQFGTTRIAFQVRRSDTRTTVGLAVDPRHGLVVTAPQGVPLARLEGVVQRKGAWVLQHLKRAQQQDPAVGARAFVSGEGYLYLGRSFRLSIKTGDGPVGARMDHARLIVHTGSTQDAEGTARRLVVGWYRARAQERLEELVQAWSARLGVGKPVLRVTEARKRWGSCGRGRTVRINWRVIQAPMSLVEYVVVHELTHLKHPRHDRVFWAAVARALPDYEERKDRLRRLGPRLVW